MNPRKSTAAAAGVLLSGFLPSNSLLESLLRVSDEVAASANAPTPLFLQSRNCLRRPPDPPPLPALRRPPPRNSAAAPARDTLPHRALLRRPADKGRHRCARLRQRALGGLDVTADAREQVELAHRQLKRAEVFVGRDELRLREELIEAMGKNYKDGDDDRRDHLNNWEKMEAIMRTLGVRSASDYDEEIRRLEAEIPKQAGTGGSSRFRTSTAY
uniref:Uncharacterized protein n=1 Tax=Ananas comosus var. bracteatus TaxID=296719 RepID=A0A6V7QSK1_ANACO